MLQLTPFEKTVIGQELIQIGFKEGMQQGMQEGHVQGQLERARKALYDVLEARFDLVPQRVIHAIQSITDLQVLEELHRKAVKVTDLKEFNVVLKKVLE